MDTVHECDRQTDRQTDGQTDRFTITDTVQTASHGKNWYHFTRLQIQKLLFLSPVASSKTVCSSQPAKTSVMRCFSLSKSFTDSGIHATVHSPKCFIFLRCLVYGSSFQAENKVVNVADIGCCMSCSWHSAIPVSYTHLTLPTILRV